MRTGISAIAFDLDGTLYPNSGLYIRLLPFLARHWPLVAALGRARNIIREKQELSSESYVSDFYSYQAQIVAKLLKKPQEQIREKLDRLIYRGWEPHFLKIKMFPHVQELLIELRTTPLKLGILSDFPLRSKLKNLGIAEYWDVVLSAEDTGALKPALRPFSELARALGCPAEHILYVGNSRFCDAHGARRAGMKTALRTSRFVSDTTVADFIFHDYRQLHDFVIG